MGRYWRGVENTDVYRISSRTISTSVAISKEYKVTIHQFTKHSLDALATLQMSGVPIPDQQPACIHEHGLNTYVIKYLFPQSQTNYRRKIIRFFSVLGFSIGVVSLLRV